MRKRRKAGRPQMRKEKECREDADEEGMEEAGEEGEGGEGRKQMRKRNDLSCERKILLRGWGEEGEVCRHWAQAKMHAAAWQKPADQ